MTALDLPRRLAPVPRTTLPERPDRSARKLRRGWSPGGVLGIMLLLGLLALALAGPALIGIDPGKQVLRARLAPPVLFGGTSAHPLGTDQLGRDLLARLAEGGRTSLLIGVIATLISGCAGVALGVIAGYLGGRIDRFVSFAADVQLALPFVLIAIAVVAVLGNSTSNAIAILAVSGWVGYTRVVRLEVRRLRNAPFVEAARALGASRWRVMGRHIMPNVAGPVIVIASQQVAGMILFEAALSYLGLGVSAGTITWGSMIADGRETLLSAWWVATIPGIAIAVTILGLNLTGDWVIGVRE